MKILIDIGHPGHVHYFRNVISILKERGHEFLIVSRDRKVAIELLKKYNLPFVNRGKGKNTRIGKLLYMFKADYKVLRLSLKFKPDIFVSFSSPYASQVAYLLGKPHIALTDTEHEDKMLSRFVYPFSDVIITPKSYLNNLGEKHVRINSVIESFYLDKTYYNKNEKIKKELGVSENEEYVILRFVSWTAHHDHGHSGLDIESKRQLVKLLSSKYRLFISSETELTEEFSDYKIQISPEKMHDVLAGATLFIGESATMSSESALLGTYSVYINSLPLMGYLKLEEEQGLLKHFENSEGLVTYVKELIKDENLKQKSIERSALMQKDFINPTTFLAWFIEDFPNSKKIMIDDSDYQNKFKG